MFRDRQANPLGHHTEHRLVGGIAPLAFFGHGNTRWRVTAVVPLERIAEFIDRPLAGILEVEPT
jgi:hypothetical protein